MATMDNTITSTDLKGLPKDSRMYAEPNTVRATEVPKETRFSVAFTKFLPVLAHFIEAERDLEDINHSFDPAYGNWLRDAVAARAGVSGYLLNFHAMPVHLPEDRPLRRAALLVDAMLNDEDPSRPRHLHRQMQLVFFQQFQVRGFGPTAQHRNALLIRAWHLIDAMARLPLFDFNPVDPIDEPDAWGATEMSPSGF